MLKKAVTAVAMIALSMIAAASETRNGVEFFIAQGDVSAAYAKMVKSDLASVGFVLSDPHERINDVYKEKYGVSMVKGKPNDAYDPDFRVTLDNLGFFTVSNDGVLRELLMKAPSLGGFSPFNLLIFKKKDENSTYVGHVAPETMLDIAGVEDAQIRSTFIDSFEPLDALIAQKLGGREHFVRSAGKAAVPMMRYSLKFDRTEALDDFVDAFQEKFEAAFEGHHFLIAGYKNFKEAYTDKGEDFGRFDRYWVYALCHFVFSYNVFNKGLPEAGVFAPCSMYMYIEKNSNVLHIGMPSLENWKAVFGITDPGKLQRLKDLDTEIDEIMTKEVGATKL